jgi:hypothetical protein
MEAQFRPEFPLSGKILCQIPRRQTAQSSPHCFNVNFGAKVFSIDLTDQNLPGLSQGVFSANSAVAAFIPSASTRARATRQSMLRHHFLLISPTINFLLNYNKIRDLSTYQGFGKNDKIN